MSPEYAPLPLLLTLLLPLVLGHALLRATGFVPREDRWAWAAWSWMLGGLGIAASEALWIAAGLPLRALPLDGALLVLAAVLLVAARRSDPRRAALPPPAPRSIASRTGDLVLAGALLLAFSRTFLVAWNYSSTPILKGDEASIWTAKARALYVGASAPQFLGEMLRDRLMSHADYPCLNPLLQVFAFVQIDGMGLSFERIPLQASAIALVLAVAAALRARTNGFAAALGTLLVAGLHRIWAHARWAESDILVAFGFVVACDAWMRFDTTRERRWWRLFAWALAFLVAAKNEGSMIAVAWALGLVWSLGAARALGIGRAGGGGVLRREPRLFAWLALPALVALASWWFDRSFDLRNDLLGDNPQGRSLFGVVWTEGPQRLRPVLAALYHQLVVDLERGRGLLLAAPLCALLLGRRLFAAPFATPALALAASLAGYVLVFLGTPHDLGWHLPNLERVVFHLLPALAVWCGAALAARPIDRPAHGPAPESPT